ncbi:MAG TPA: LLM class flavin-dependent oxidoreductase, partial [Pseudonocardia sp.]|nr:LLM class flavin-dependent oxidoreductase [Pseudonocardia sp.]
HGLDCVRPRPLVRLEDALRAVRELLREGHAAQEGEFLDCDGLRAAARPVQEHLPVMAAVPLGERSCEVAGRAADGCHHAFSGTQAAYRFMAETVRAEAMRAGRDWRRLDIAAWVLLAVGPDPEAARRAARCAVAVHAPFLPADLLRRNGVDPAELEPVAAAIAAGDVPAAVTLTRPHVVERLSVAGTPGEVADRICGQLAHAGVNHVVAALLDAAVVRAVSGMAVHGLPDVDGQLALLRDEVIPVVAAPGPLAAGAG